MIGLLRSLPIAIVGVSRKYGDEWGQIFFTDFTINKNAT